MSSPISAFILTIKWPLWSLLVFVVTLGVLQVNGFMPEPITTEASENAPAEATISDALPSQILIDAIGVSAPILNPDNTDVAVLDNALLSGVVRYPGSADLGNSNNMLLFGHSSSRPVVNNQMFKVFNGLRNLKKGDVIRVRSDTHENVYRVSNIVFAEAENVSISISGTKKKLILSSCNSFAGKGDRVIVEAEFVETTEVITIY